MQLNKLPVVVSVLIAWACPTDMVGATPSQNKPTDIIEGVVHIVTSCYGDRIDAVGLAGYVPDDLPSRLAAQHLIPVAVIDTIRSVTDPVYTTEPQFRHELQVFIVEAPSAIQLADVIKRIRFSIWWNHMATFFILDRSDECGQTLDFLWIAWQSNVLNGNVLCDQPDDGRVIVTYNPFTSMAPTPWERANDVVGEYDHPFVLFYRKYRESVSNCVNLDFEKTTDLGGYPTIIEGLPLGVDTGASRTPSIYQFWSKQERFFHILSRVLNTKLLFTGRAQWAKVIDVHMRKWPGLLVERLYGRMTTYPHMQKGIVIITQFRGHKSQLNKILCVIDFASRIGLGIVYLITLIFLKFFIRQALVPAFLNLVRMTCDSGFTNLLDNTASRLYMTSLLFFAVTMQGIYQGNLAAWLTQQFPLRQVDTMENVVDFGYKLYGPLYVKNLVDDLKLKERYKRVQEYDNCVTHVINDSSAACLWLGGAGVLDLAQEFNLHISSEIVEIRHVTYEIRWDWPLQRRIDAILAKFVEADILDTWEVRCNPIELSDFQIDEEVKKNKDFKNIELRELAFSFVILGIGLLCATITFIVEWAIQYRCIFVHRQNINWLV